MINIFTKKLIYFMYLYISKRFTINKRNISSQYTSSGYAIADLNVFHTILYATYLVLIIRAVTII